MVKLLKDFEEKRKKISGRLLKLIYADKILMMLEYLREYRTYYHISVDYSISESSCYKMINLKVFSLPTKNRLMNDMEIEVILVDATEVLFREKKLHDFKFYKKSKLKPFRIISETYRNRRKRFGLRFNLIACIYNFELKIKDIK